MTKIKCNVGDAPTPVGELPVLRLRNPFDTLELNSGAKHQVRVKTGIRFNVPVLIFEWEGTLRQRVKLANNGTLVQAGTEIMADLECTALEGEQHTAFFERGDTLLQVTPLTNDGSNTIEFVP